MGSRPACFALFMSCVLLGACGSSDQPTPTDAGSDRGPIPYTPCDPRYFADAAVDPGAGATYDYVITRLSVDPPAEPGDATHGFYGFNLDGRTSPARTASQLLADCSHGDYFSILDPDQNASTCVDGEVIGGSECRGGIDNQLPKAARVIAQFGFPRTGQVLLNEQIDAGRYAVIVRVGGVHGTQGSSLDDPAVTIRVYPVAWPTFMRCPDIQQPGQTYAVDDRSLRRAGDLDAPVMEFAGCILHGRLRQTAVGATGAATPMTLPLVDDARVPLHDLQLRFDLAADEGRNGNLGGTLVRSEVVENASAVLSDPRPGIFRLSVAALVEGLIDIATPADGGVLSCDPPSGLIGVGLGFTAVRANIQSTTVTGPIAGACGAP